MLEIVVRQGDLTKIQADAIVNPANSFGVMGGGVAGVIKRVGGEEIEREAMHKAPIPVGSAVATTAGKLPCRFVIHTPTMEQPAQRTDALAVTRATEAALSCAEQLGLSTIAIPGMGTGVGRVPIDEAAGAIVDTIKSFVERSVTRVILIDVNEEIVNAFRTALKRRLPGPEETWRAP